MARGFWRQVLDALTHTGPGYEHTPVPRRGDAVDQWLFAQRARFIDDGPAWVAVDEVLDQYRLHADTRTPLDQHVCEGGTVDDCYGCYRAKKASR